MRRAATGPIMAEKDFMMKRLIPAIRETLKTYDIIPDMADPVSKDDALADRLFQAAYSLLTRTGVYCEATNRVIELDDREMLQDVARFDVGKSSFGEGRDRRCFKARKPDDGNLPWLHVGAGIVASSEAVAEAQVEGYASLPEACSVSIPAFGSIEGMYVSGGSPLEIVAGASSVAVARKALKQVGRPGLPIMNLLSSATTAMGTIAVSHPQFGLRPSDGWLIDIIPEMKVNYETLNRLTFILMTNGNIGSTAVPILGGYAGGAAGTALLMTAYYILGIHLFKGCYHLTLPIHFKFGCNSLRDTLWIFSITGRATSRNACYPAIALGYAAAGPCTEMYFYEAAAILATQVVAGYAGVQTPHPAKAVLEDGITPMEAGFTVAFAKAVSGIGSQQAGELVSRLLKKYETHIEHAPSGSRYAQCYDLKTRRPRETYVTLYNRVCEEIAGMGLEI
ncbi:MAG: monomethylamine:corrinoid methyltransferase [Pseudomonadota bacterium]